MEKIYLLTDSSSSIEKDEYENLSVLDYKFYRKKTDDYEIAETSVPSIDKVRNVILEKIKLGYNKFIAITISKRLSGFFNVFQVAFENLDVEYVVIDSKTTGSQLGLIVRYAVDLVDNGLNHEEIIKNINLAIKNSKVYFVPENLIALKESGRLFNISTVLDIFNKKHIFTIDDGIIKLVRNSFGMKEGVGEIISIIKDELRSKNKYYISIVDLQEKFIEDIERELDLEITKSIYYKKISCSDLVKLYSGEEIVSIAFLTDTISFK